MNADDFEYLKCPTCGMDLKEIKEKKIIGCSDCLFFFRDIIVDILLKSKDGIIYSGEHKKPDDVGEQDSIHSIEKLKLLLKKSIKKEDYEMAIYFREKIKQLEQV